MCRPRTRIKEATYISIQIEMKNSDIKSRFDIGHCFLLSQGSGGWRIIFRRNKAAAETNADMRKCRSSLNKFGTAGLFSRINVDFKEVNRSEK